MKGSFRDNLMVRIDEGYSNMFEKGDRRSGTFRGSKEA
jgi:hypothetical protein